MHSVVASLAVELQESQWPQFLSEHQTISHVKVGSGGQPCVWMRRGNIFKNIKEVWMSVPGIIWTTEFLRCKSVLNGYLNTSLSDCTDLLSDNTPAVPVKLSISRSKGLQSRSITGTCVWLHQIWVRSYFKYRTNEGRTQWRQPPCFWNQEPNLNHNHWHNEVASGLLNGRKVRSPCRAGGFFLRRGQTNLQIWTFW